ncbi:MAG: riboflavin kinase [Candidatus Gracilibacteria bacterium]
MENFPVFHGEVEKGAGLGKKLGFPTFNLHVDPFPDLPHAVYAVRASVGAGGSSVDGTRTYNALMHFGPKPSVHMTNIFCEVYLLGFADEFEVREMDIEVLGKIREVMKFESLDALVEQMKKDEALAISQYFTL